jgi:hypothetical protein
MARLSHEAKKALIEKALARDARTLDEIAKVSNVSLSSLNRQDYALALLIILSSLLI